MQTTLRLKVSELDSDFVHAIKALFKKDREIEITISSTADFGLNKTETKEEYLTRLRNAVENIENGRVVSLSGKEFEDLNQKLTTGR